MGKVVKYRDTSNRREGIAVVDREKIEALRKSAGLTQEEFAASLGLTPVPRFIDHIEKGYKQPSAALLKRMAELFGCTMDELMKDSA